MRYSPTIKKTTNKILEFRMTRKMKIYPINRYGMYLIQLNQLEHVMMKINV